MMPKDLNYGYSESVPGTEDFQEVVSIELGGGYEWNSLEAWYSPGKRRFFWIEGSGCSCNSLGEGFESINDLDSGSREELITAVRNKYEGAYNASFIDGLADMAMVKAFKAQKKEQA